MSDGGYMGLAAVIGSVATLAGVLGNVYLQLKQLKLSQSNSAKLESNSSKINQIHEATTSMQETGVFKKLDA